MVRTKKRKGKSMKQKSPDELRNSIVFYRVVTVVLVVLVVFIGFNNIRTTDKFRNLDACLQEQKEKNKSLENELNETKKDIVMGTCLLKLKSGF
jgi:cell division protein FtsL